MIKVNIKDAKKMWVWDSVNTKTKRWVVCELEDGYLALGERVSPDNYMEFWSPFVIFRHAEIIQEEDVEDIIDRLRKIKEATSEPCTCTEDQRDGYDSAVCDSCYANMMYKRICEKINLTYKSLTEGI